MHVSQHTIHSLPKQLDYFGTAGMCPFDFQRPLMNTVDQIVQQLVIENKQIKSDLSYLGMT